jgi:hypothetical protein
MSETAVKSPAKTVRSNSGPPDMLSIASFFVRSKYFQTRRSVADRLRPPMRMPEALAADFPHVLGESIVSLLTDADPRERALLLGKVENLRLACRSIHGRSLAANATFSFWRQVGPPWKTRGFVMGREVREGCIVPSFGGGLCQLSGSLLDAATQAGLEVMERHRHTALPDDIEYRPERDATVFWNYVDLRLRADQSVLIESFLTSTDLVVRMRGELPGLRKAQLPVVPLEASPVKTLEASCYSCGQTSCVRHPQSDEPSSRTRTR